VPETVEAVAAETPAACEAALAVAVSPEMLPLLMAAAIALASTATEPSATAPVPPTLTDSACTVLLAIPIAVFVREKPW
jgi:hypothetical protein